jgi:hypothetical protein
VRSVRKAAPVTGRFVRAAFPSGGVVGSVRKAAPEAGRFVHATFPSGGVVGSVRKAAPQGCNGQLPREMVIADEQPAVMYVPATGRCA